MSFQWGAAQSWPDQQFGVALDKVKLSETNRRVLQAFLDAPDRTLSAHTLAEAAQLPGGWMAANLRIGELARKFRPFLGELPDAGDRNPHWWRYVTTGQTGSDARFYWTLRPGLVRALLARGWRVREVGRGQLPQEVPDAGALFEGAVQQISVNAYERSHEARQRCIEHHGAVCQVCRVDMAQVYGIYGQGYVEVHHLRPLAQIGDTYRVDPVRDLVPVCPNCHAMLHRTDPPLSVEALRRAMAQAARQD